MNITGVLEPRLLATLAAVADAGSFSDAADDLGVTQSAVSQQIAELERRVGERVLLRRPFRVTAAGEVLVAAAGRIRAALAIADQDLRALNAGESGTLTVAAFTSAASGPVPAALAEFRRDLPAVTVRLTQMEPLDAYAGVLRGDIDVAVTYQYPQSPRPIPDGIDIREIARDEFVAAVPVGHPLARQPRVVLAEVNAAGLIGTPMTNLPLPWPDGSPNWSHVKHRSGSS
jgi:DNA-binding transcriptional LysR family regulator